MTNLEIINEFDILYNNIRNNSAPGLDLYEQSLFLTKAQEQIVFNTFNPKTNLIGEGFENTEKRRQDLKKLVKNYITDLENIPSNIENSDYSTSINLNGFINKFIKIPNDVFFIIEESCIFESDIIFDVLPISHDELKDQIQNPFRKPVDSFLNKRIWRLDNDISNLSNSIELIYTKNLIIQDYQMRYIKKPSPIILTNLDEGEFIGSGLSIDGVIDETPCELNDIIQRQIIDRAVILALEAYEKSRIQTFPQVSAKNE